jgi:dipeptide/tripeptide permease
MDFPNSNINLDDIDDNINLTVTAKDIKIVLSVLKIGASRGLFKPEEFTLLGQLYDNSRKALFEQVQTK